MTAKKSWKKDFGIEDWGAPAFFANKQDVDTAIPPPPQAHALRRAFDRLKLTGIVCFDNAPTVYFRESQEPDAPAEQAILRLFWNQGLAPVLVVISDTEARIHSSLILPANGRSVVRRGSLVRTLNLAAEASEVRQFILSVQSGEFFRANSKSFDPKQRVDRELLRNLRATREQLSVGSARAIDPLILDALLCRLVFTCYLFDRGIIDEEYLESVGIPKTKHLRDILGRSPRSEGKRELYALFQQLGEHFNGDLFSDDLDKESNCVTAKHLDTVNAFFRGTDPEQGQQTFWPYDFGVIPIETISAIYEHFLKAGGEGAKKASGAFYTPRFLAEMLLDIALEGTPNLLEKRFLDPACGSGIFLVALFNRLAEEWSRKNPKANYDAQVKGFTGVLKTNLFGIDSNPTACRITAFSLYLAFLDQLSPPDIRRVLKKTKMLPRLLADGPNGTGTIRCADFFEVADTERDYYNLIVGNPPWKSEGNAQAPLVAWCAERNLPLPDRQAAIAFAWKAPQYLVDGGRVCFVLPHGILFNHGQTALEMQKRWLTAHQVEVVLNLADFQRFLFEEAENPALVIRFLKHSPTKKAYVRYLSPKVDWKVTQAELVSIYPEDQAQIRLSEVIGDLDVGDVPLAWKEKFWGTPRDWKLLDRLRQFPKLDEVVRSSAHRWTTAQGFLEPRPADAPEVAKTITLPTEKLVQTRRVHAGLFIIEDDCEILASRDIVVRRRLDTDIFLAPHVLVTDGFKVAYGDFDVSFRQAVRGIHGPKKDRDLLAFLAAYLRSPLANYYLFHTSGNVGIERAKVEKGEMLRMPFPLPEHTKSPVESEEIIHKVASLVFAAIKAAKELSRNRDDIVTESQNKANGLIYRYFDIDPIEAILVEDTNRILMQSVRRRKATDKIPTLRASTKSVRDEYTKLLCETLNDWAKAGPYRLVGQVLTSTESGIGVVIIDKLKKGEASLNRSESDDVIPILERLEFAYRKKLGTVSIVRSIKVFEPKALYLTKPLSQRFWTRTAALNDADSIATAILGRPAKGGL